MLPTEIGWEWIYMHFKLVCEKDSAAATIYTSFTWFPCEIVRYPEKNACVYFVYMSSAYVLSKKDFGSTKIENVGGEKAVPPQTLPSKRLRPIASS